MGIPTPSKAPRRATAPVVSRKLDLSETQPIRARRGAQEGVYLFIAPFFNKRVSVTAQTRAEAEQRARRMLDRIRCGSRGMSLLKFDPF